MTEQRKQDAEEGLDPLEMSDEDFLNADPSTFTQNESASASGSADDSDDDDDDSSGEKSPEELEEERRAALTDEEREEEDAAAATAQADKGDGEADGAKGPDADGEAGKDGGAKDPDDEAAKKDEEKSSSNEITDDQFAEIGRKVMGEFKANGKPMKVKSVEDAIQLMQMGANYHKKMAGLKPSLKTLKLLEIHGLLDETKLNYLIDLSQKKPEAITKLLKDSKVDPMDLDLQGEDNYVAENRSVSDTELLLDEVLDGIKDSPSYERTLNVLGDDWDEGSRNMIGKDPAIITTINAHMESGVFDQVADQVAYERSLGKLRGINDFEAYQQVGHYMHENNMFKHATGDRQRQDSQQDPDTNQSQQRQSDKEQARQNRKKAASPSRQKKAPVEKKNDEFNPLAMSDEEFIKHTNMSF